jgi:formate dehydrogenase maturation protein FdhE
LPPDLALYKELLNIQLNAIPGISVYANRLTKAEIFDRLARGIPLLKFDDLNIDWKIFNDVLKNVIAILPRFTNGANELSGRLEKQIDNTDLKIASRLRFENREACCSETKINDELGFVLDVALRTFLIKPKEVLTPLVEQEQWRKGYCPICGGLPDFAFLDKENGARWLICSRCDSQWLYKRMGCPYCDSQNMNKTSYFSDDEEIYRVYVCEQCKCYLKTIDLRRAKGDIILPLERIMTADLDEQVNKRGYFERSHIKDDKVKC